LKHILTSIVCNKKEIDEILSLLQNEGINSNIILKYPENIPEEHRNPAKNNYESAIPLYNVIKNSNNINPKIFQNIYIVQKRQTAQKLAWENNDSPAELHFITQDGEIFTSYGRIKTNWYEQSTNKLLSRKNVIENLQKDIQKKSRIINDIKEKIENVASEKLEKNKLLNSLSKKIEVLKNILEDNKKTNIKRTLQLENLINLQNEYDNNLIKIQKELNDIEAHLKEIEIQLLTLPNINIDELIKKQEILTGKLQKMKNSKYQIENKFHNTQIEIAKLKKDDYFISEKIKKNEMIVNDNEDILTKSEKSIIPMKEEISKSEKLTDNIEIKFRQEIDNLNKYKTIVLKTENQFRILRSENEKIKLNLHELEFRKDALTKDKNNIELKSQEIKLTLNHIKDDVISHFHHDLTHDDPEDCLDLDSHNLTDEISKNQKSLENLGPINLSAIDDYKTQKERLKFLKEQREDLIHSQNNLRMAISQLNNTAEKMFLETFNQIQQNFQKIFKEVFNGGRGILRLQDKSQPLDSKIEILSNPKGKKISNINLLSSGEKALTAITLIFSIYLVKPSPFCILDEIDAPLDDANINRFLVLLNKFSKDTQFIIISHNKRTIEEVDYLYGITMEEDGVSKIVSVEFT
ncbi:MAG: hypothetical protein H8D22_04505, partial [Candidatus Cloacimonetes bacterium]|nr:hypothetical protein [Candidatus Cloacimonadota bacterium]